jgi:amino acid transporter
LVGSTLPTRISFAAPLADNQPLLRISRFLDYFRSASVHRLTMVMPAEYRTSQSCDWFLWLASRAEKQGMSDRKKLGVWQLFAAAIGVIVSQIGMISLTQGVGIGGWGFLLAMAVAFLIAMANAMAYAEMALMMPSAGSLSRYAEVAIGDFPAILLVFAGYVTPALVGLPAELILTDQILGKTLPIHAPPFVWPIAIVVVFTILNILGTDVFARIQTALSFTVLVFLLVTGLTAVSGHAAAPIAGGTSAAFASLNSSPVILGVVALAFWVFVGSEFVTPMITEAKNAERDLPRAMIGGLAAIFAAQMIFAVGSAFMVPRQVLAASATPHLDYALATFGPSAKPGFAGLAVIASASLINTVLAAVPRMLWGMAENGQVFPILKYLHPRFGTPVIGIVFVASLPIVGLLWARGDTNAILPLMIAASVAWLLAYIVAQISLIILRRRYPHVHRPFRVPGYPVVPVLAIVGMIYVVAHSAPTPAMASQIAAYTGIVLAVFAVIGGLWVKLAMKKGLFEPSPIDAP